MARGSATPEPGATWAFGLLGDLRVARDGQPLSPPVHRARGLLALLLLRPDLRRRERLSATLFPDLPAPAGRRRLSDLLYLLRTTLPDLPLDVTTEEVRLDPARRWLDVEDFWRHAAGGAAVEWQQAIDLYRGELAEGVYDDWLLAEREALYLTYVATAHRLGEALLLAGRCGEAIPLFERLVRDEPYDEAALRGLMRAYQAVGRRGAALSAYERFAALAVDELQAEPEEATRSLARWLREGAARAEPSLAPDRLEREPEALLRQGRSALARGDWAQVEACLDALGAAGGSPLEGAAPLEVDLALARYDLLRAKAALARIDEGATTGPALRARSAELALSRHDASAAVALASEALLQAHQASDRAAEFDALCCLVRAQQQLGQGMQAIRLAAQTMALARESGRAEDLARALVLSARSALIQGQYAQAMAHLSEARALALAHGMRLYLIAALAGTRLVACNTNRLSEARETVQEELLLCRDLGLEHAEAGALEGLALVEDLSGRSRQSRRALERAHAISRRLGDPLRLAINRYNLACTLIYERDCQAPRAIEEARQALATFRDLEQPSYVAAALTILGYALWVHREHAAALTTFREAVEACERAGQLNRVPELLAYQGLAYLGAGFPREALEATRRAVLAMTQGEVSREVVPEIYYARAMALAANDMEESAATTLRQAYESLLAGGAEIQDEAARQAFFARNPSTRRLMDALRAHGMALSPHEGTIARRLAAQRGGQEVRVVWTVDAGPADAALRKAHGAVALRRARLARLLAEAENQGGRPTVAQLAEALGVSERTIQRDMASLRRDAPRCPD